MAWIESHQELAHHPKVARLAHMLDIDKASAIGHLHLFWWWVLSYADDGDVSEFDAFELAHGAQWGGDPALFVGSLEDAGWIDDGQVHDWWDYAGKLVERRQENARRKRNMRAFYAEGTAERVKQRDGDRCRYCRKEVSWSDRRSKDGATYDHVDPFGPETEENVVVACRGCNSTKGQRTPGEAGMTLVPVPGAIRSALDTDQAGFSTQPTQPTEPTNNTRTDAEFSTFHARRAAEAVKERKRKGLEVKSDGGLARTIQADPEFRAESERLWAHRDCSNCKGTGSTLTYAPGTGGYQVECDSS